jgi:hypothetical protein
MGVNLFKCPAKRKQTKHKKQQMKIKLKKKSITKTQPSSQK